MAELLDIVTAAKSFEKKVTLYCHQNGIVLFFYLLDIISKVLFECSKHKNHKKAWFIQNARLNISSKYCIFAKSIVNFNAPDELSFYVSSFSEYWTSPA